MGSTDALQPQHGDAALREMKHWIDIDTPSALVVTSQADAGFWTAIVEAAGARMLASVSGADALARMAVTVDVDVVIVDCCTGFPGIDALIVRLDAMAHAGNGAIIFVTNMPCLDMVDSIVSASNALILCEPNERDLAAALFSTLRQRQLPSQLNDSGQYGEITRLDKLVDDVGRLTSMLESFVGHGRPSVTHDKEAHRAGTSELFSPAKSYTPPPENLVGHGEETIKAEQVRAVLRARRLRDQLLSGDLFADPAWDILLDLMAAHLEGNKVSVSSLCIAAAVPPTTALRWIQQLTDRGLLLRRADKQDGRRIFITLSHTGLAAVRTWFDISRPLLQSAVGG
ncbi:MAG: MarR family transcriptional regulator [Sphingobium sp.]